MFKALVLHNSVLRAAKYYNGGFVLEQEGEWPMWLLHSAWRTHHLAFVCLDPTSLQIQSMCSPCARPSEAPAGGVGALAGDSFTISFYDPFDAVVFCLQVGLSVCVCLCVRNELHVWMGKIWARCCWAASCAAVILNTQHQRAQGWWLECTSQ